jgi:hypothetical protein
VALILGANVFKGRRGRKVLTFVSVGLIVFLGVGVSQITPAYTGWEVPSLQIVETTCSSSAGSCTSQITNSGSASASIIGASVYGKMATMKGAPVIVPAGTTSADPVAVTITGLSLTAGVSVSGALVVGSGSPLAFSAIASE